ncbi:MAG TPA: hypothetical protein VK555_04405 [Terriglobales bacterium]|nr:hypothetical protein [Terriglobales bacterium]
MVRKARKGIFAIAQRRALRELQSEDKPALSASNQAFAGSYHRDTFDGGEAGVSWIASNGF